MAGCGWDCTVSCNGCGTGCSVNCLSGCEGNCSSGCSSECEGCDSSCSSGCKTNCSGSCNGDCEDECDGCSSGCSGDCEGGCSSGCSSGCYTTCSNGCYGNCGSGCQDICANHCTGGAMVEVYKTLLDMIIIINEYDASALRDLIFYELERRDNDARFNLPITENQITLDTIVTSAWWKSLQDALKTEGKTFTNNLEDNTIITVEMRNEIRDKVIELYEKIYSK